MPESINMESPAWLGKRLARAAYKSWCESFNRKVKESEQLKELYFARTDDGWFSIFSVNLEVTPIFRVQYRESEKRYYITTMGTSSTLVLTPDEAQEETINA